MTRIHAAILTCIFLSGITSSAQNQDIQQRVAQLKQAMAENHKQLMQYQWLQTIDINIKGKTRKNEAMMCRYDANGKVIKTPAGPVDNMQQQKTGGLRGRIIANKIEDMKEYTERLKSLISHYAPPQPERIKEAMHEGNANLNQSSADITTLTFMDYYKPGDEVIFTFNMATKKISSYNVNTYLDDPKKDIVTLSNQFATLPDGTNYLAQTILNAKAKQILVTTTNTNYSPLAK